MSRTENLIKAAALGSCAALALTACGGDGGNGGDGEGDITLQYAFFAPATTFPGVQMDEWAERIEERTNGQVTVETFPGGTLLESGDIYDGVSSGIVDVGLDLPSYDPSQFPISSAASLPLGFEDAQQASAAFLEFILEEDPEELDGFFIVTAFATEPVYIMTADPVTSRDDLSGMTLRSPGGMHIPTIEALGATPVGMPTTEIAENLGTGVIDGMLGTREQLQDFEFAEFLPYLTELPLGLSGTFIAVMDEDEFNALPEDVQDEIVGLREEISAFAAERQDTHAADSVEWAIENHGLEVLEVDDAETQEVDGLMEEIVDDWIEEHQDAGFDPQEVIDRLTELRDAHAG